ncbi:MAG: toxic anion resistance protein [Oscillospiraceae bacterium]|jgi:uncharacterized protein YaaN involved in tellurite resistance|nr:toxic anion resistance protein [Oscillospiraceae bacterium]
MENTNFTPALTLDGNSAFSAAAAIAVAESEAAVPAVSPGATESAPALDLSKLSEEEQKQVVEFAGQIDITNTNQILTYGSSSQRNIADFSQSTLDKVRSKDAGEVGKMLSSLVVELKGFNYDTEEKKGIFGLRKKAASKIAQIKADYSKVETNVENISEMLEKHQMQLLKDAAMLDKMYELNEGYFKELTMYILAGKKKLEECRTVTLPELLNTAEASGLPEDAQKANDYANMVNRFEKKLYDLELTRMISIQMAPQIRLIQNNDTLLVEKIQTSVSSTIPLWKSQMVLAIGMHNSSVAMEAQREVSEMTNALLRKNAEILKTGSIEIAKESERGIADIETLKATNVTLIETLEEVQRIQAEGRTKRAEAEIELGRIENELKDKLLTINKV